MSLGLTSRKLVAAARSGLDPSPDVAARVRARVAAATAPVSAPAATIGIAKLVAIGAIVSAICAVWFVAPRAATPAPTIAVPVVEEEVPQLELHVTSAVHSEPAPIAIARPVIVQGEAERHVPCCWRCRPDLAGPSEITKS